MLMRKLKNTVQAAVPAVPFALTCFAINEKSEILGLVAVVCLFATVHIMPICRKRENIWVFMLSAINLTPVNVVMCFRLVKALSYGAEIMITDWLWGLLICFVLFCVEEIVLGITARLIWKRQYIIMLK